MDILDLASKTLRAERENDKSMPRAKDEHLEERIGVLDKENSELHD